MPIQNNCFMPGASPPPSQYCHMPMYGNAGPSITHSMMPSPMTCNWPGSQSSPSATVSPYPFTLKVLSARIQICQSCRIPFHSTSTEEPFDLVVARKECRPYKTQGGETKTPSVPSNSHYHVSMQCIRAAEPMFMPQQMVVPEDVYEHLTDVHKGFLFASFGLKI